MFFKSVSKGLQKSCVDKCLTTVEAYFKYEVTSVPDTGVTELALSGPPGALSQQPSLCLSAQMQHGPTQGPLRSCYGNRRCTVAPAVSERL